MATVDELIASVRREIKEPYEEQSYAADEDILQYLQEGYDDLTERTRTLQGTIRFYNVAINQSSVSATDDTIILANACHAEQGDEVVYNALSPPSPDLTDGASYYVVPTVQPEIIQLATSVQNAHIGTVINITGDATGSFSFKLKSVDLNVLVDEFNTAAPSRYGEKILDVQNVYCIYSANTVSQLKYISYSDYAKYSDNTDGNPSVYTVNDNRIYIYPRLSVNQGIKIIYDRYGKELYKTPASFAGSVPAGKTLTPEIQEQYHNLIWKYAVANILLSEGSPKARDYFSLYQAGLQEMSSSNLRNTSRGITRVASGSVRRW